MACPYHVVLPFTDVIYFDNIKRLERYLNQGALFMYSYSIVRTRPNRQTVRLSNWNYASPGWYFVTICVKNRRKDFGYICRNRICVSDVGTTAHRYWQTITNHFDNVKLDQFIVMPDHIHGIIKICKPSIVSHVGTCHGMSLQCRCAYNQFKKPIPKSLSMVINHYKSAVTRWCHKNNHTGFQWQSRFYERIIRTETELKNVRKYIRDNPRNDH